MALTVPQDRLDALCEQMRRSFPDARDVRPCWSPQGNGEHEVLAEVHHHDGRVQVFGEPIPRRVRS